VSSTPRAEDDVLALWLLLGTRRDSRVLTCWNQALFVLVWFRKRDDLAVLGAGFGISRAISPCGLTCTDDIFGKRSVVLDRGGVVQCIEDPCDVLLVEAPAWDLLVQTRFSRTCRVPDVRYQVRRSSRNASLSASQLIRDSAVEASDR
jgi:hypothetical protein